MKLSMKPTRKDYEDMASCVTNTTQRVKGSEVSANAGIPKRLRRLKWNELVRAGHFVADGQRGFEPWEGLGGFRADSFVKPIYRREENPTIATKK